VLRDDLGFGPWSFIAYLVKMRKSIVLLQIFMGAGLRSTFKWGISSRINLS